MPRMTAQKKQLYEEIKNCPPFFDAYELHQRTKKKIGLATIYRFLSVLESDGELHSFTCENKRIYSRDKTSHAHFRCEKCNRTEHIKMKNVDFLKSVDGEVCHFQIEIVGICTACK